MDRTDALTGLDSAQRSVARHLANARLLVRDLPHGEAGLTSTKTVMGSLGRGCSPQEKIPTATQLAEELYSGPSAYGAPCES